MARWTKNPHSEGDMICPHGYSDYGAYCGVCDKEFVSMLDGNT